MTSDSSSWDAELHASGMAEPVVTVVVIEDNRLLHDALCEMLRQQRAITVRQSTLSATSVEAQMELAESVGHEARGAPVVVLLDVNLAERDSVLVCSRLCRAVPDLRLVVMGVTVLHAEIAELVSAGAMAFIMNDASADECLRTIWQAARGEPLLPPALTPSLFAQIARERDKATPAGFAESVSLTVREREIISLLGEGLSNRDIAERLHIAIHTVKSHVHNVLEKLSLRSRLEVVALSRVLGPPK